MKVFFLRMSLWKSNLVCGSSLKTSGSLWGHSITCLTHTSPLRYFSSASPPLLFFSPPLPSFLSSQGSFRGALSPGPQKASATSPRKRGGENAVVHFFRTIVSNSNHTTWPWDSRSSEEKRAQRPPFSAFSRSFVHVLCSSALPCFSSKKNPS